MDLDTPYYDDENTGVPLRMEEGQKEGYFISNLQNESAFGTCQISRHRGSDGPRCQVWFLPRKTMKPNYCVIPHIGKFPFL